MLQNNERPAQVVLVTSSVSGEGKSTIANNLASSLAPLERVLLIDADMRQPTLSLNFDFPPQSPGLANLMAGSARLEDCIRSVGNLDMLPAGCLSPSALDPFEAPRLKASSSSSNAVAPAQDLLSSPRLGRLLQILKSRYRHIIIDSPPAEIVSDALLLAQHSDAVIYVVKAQSTPVGRAQKHRRVAAEPGAGIRRGAQSGRSAQGAQVRPWPFPLLLRLRLRPALILRAVPPGNSKSFPVRRIGDRADDLAIFRANGTPSRPHLLGAMAVRNDLVNLLLIVLVHWRIGELPSEYRLLIILTVLGSMPVYGLVQVYHKRHGLLVGLGRLLAGWLILLGLLMSIAFVTQTSALFSRQVVIVWAVVGFLARGGDVSAPAPVRAHVHQDDLQRAARGDHRHLPDRP